MSVEVTLFSPVEELVAVTVAPGMAALPDFTTPEIKNFARVGSAQLRPRQPAGEALSSGRRQTSSSERKANRRPGRIRCGWSSADTPIDWKSHHYIQHCRPARGVKNWSMTVKFRKCASIEGIRLFRCEAGPVSRSPYGLLMEQTLSAAALQRCPSRGCSRASALHSR